MKTKLQPLCGYAWKITHVNMEFMSESDVGIYNWEDENIPAPHRDDIDWSCGWGFQLFDDDGIWYATGIYTGPNDDTMFAPLDDWGMPGCGCVTMKVKENGKWVVV